VARVLPLTYTVEALQSALGSGDLSRLALDLGVLVVFAAAFFVLTSWMMARQQD